MPGDNSVICLGVLRLQWVITFSFFGTILSDRVLENLTIVCLFPLIPPLTLLENLASPRYFNLALNLNLDLDFNLDLDLVLDLVLKLYLYKNINLSLNKILFSSHFKPLLVLRELVLVKIYCIFLINKNYFPFVLMLKKCENKHF